MECEFKSEIILKMTVGQAEWLKAWLQNPFVDDEDPKDTERRHDFFETLRKAGVR